MQKALKGLLKRPENTLIEKFGPKRKNLSNIY